MVFLGIYRALYDYVPQSENELAIAEGDVLMVLEKSAEDDWWKAKKKGSDDDDEEPEGLIPNNYIEEVSFPAPLLSTLPRFVPRAWAQRAWNVDLEYPRGSY